jgi:hypothetical protein
MTRLFVLLVLAALSVCFHSFGTRRMSRSSVKLTISMKSDPGKFNAELSAHGTSRVHRVHPGVRFVTFFFSFPDCCFRAKWPQSRAGCTVPCSVAQRRTVPRSAEQCGSMTCSTVQCCAAPCCTMLRERTRVFAFTVYVHIFLIIRRTDGLCL